MALSFRKEYKKYEKLTKDEKEYFRYKNNIESKDILIVTLFLMSFFIGGCIALNYNFFMAIIFYIGSLSLSFLIVIGCVRIYLNEQDFLNKGE